MSQQDKSAKQLSEMILAAGKPDKDSETQVLPIRTNSLGKTVSARLSDIKEEILDEVGRPSQQQARQLRELCVDRVLATLIVCIFRHNWIVLPTRDKNFKSGERLARLGFDRRRMEAIQAAIVSTGYAVEGRKGFKDHSGKQSKASQYLPSQRLVESFSDCIYEISGDFDNYEPYVFTDFTTLPRKASYEQKAKTIQTYNEFMRDHTWALKGPSFRSMKLQMGRSGRIYNEYQNIAQRRVAIRKNTLLDGHAIAEPDFSANHLRMAAYLVGEELGDDPYSEISAVTDTTRDQVKVVINRCLAAKALSKRGGMIKDSHKHRKHGVVVGADMFRAIESEAKRLMPWIKKHNVFYNDIGAQMMWLEGEIALRMMTWCTVEEIPLIPVHDSFACRIQDEQLVEEWMHNCWRWTLENELKNPTIAWLQ